MPNMSKLYKDYAELVTSTCANCYKETSNRVHVGKIEGFIFCSDECALSAMKRRKN